jgi:hypothetical protein
MWLGDFERGSGLHRRGARGNARLERVDPATHKVATPQPHRVLAHPESFGDPCAGPTAKRQHYGPGAVGLGSICAADHPSPSPEICQPCPVPESNESMESNQTIVGEVRHG